MVVDTDWATRVTSKCYLRNLLTAETYRTSLLTFCVMRVLPDGVRSREPVSHNSSVWGLGFAGKQPAGRDFL